MSRLLGATGLPESDLFRSQAELLNEAYARQGARIAYVNADFRQEPGGG
jgi:hypothetical protein